MIQLEQISKYELAMPKDEQAGVALMQEFLLEKQVPGDLFCREIKQYLESKKYFVGFIIYICKFSLNEEIDMVKIQFVFQTN
jgi:hypothetical protein